MQNEHGMTNMQRYIERSVAAEVERSLAHNPVTALIGPRQCGKSTLARHLLASRRDALFLDLELPSDLRKLNDPEWFLTEHRERLVCIDEIQNKPELFPVLRAVVDMDRRPGRFVILGSASRDLIRQGGETLAGRIHYVELTPFLWHEIEPLAEEKGWNFKRHWWRGGFPPAFLAETEAQSALWRRDLIQDYLSRDIPQLGISLPARTMMRFWTMLAHYHGGLLNGSKLGQALDVSHGTVRRYLDILEQTFMVRLLRPLEANLKKRLVKSPKVYIRDSGLLHALLEIETATDLYGHPVFGASWEGWCIEQIVGAMPLWRPAFYRTSSGEEIDLVLERGPRRLAFEIKASLSPHLSRSFSDTVQALGPERVWILCPTEEQGYPTRSGARVVGITECLDDLKRMEAQTVPGPAAR
jgi:predicted AAA+ superfamily ATPase